LNFDSTFAESAQRTDRLTVEQIHQIARAVRATPIPDARTAQAVANALDSVALSRAARDRMRAEFSPFEPLRRVARWATTNF
jgi:ABC-type microcin C transport system duplicated ATPase subunit YejF